MNKVPAVYLRIVYPKPEESKEAYRERYHREPFKDFNKLIFNAYCGNVDNIHLRDLLLYVDEKIGYGAMMHILQVGYHQDNQFYENLLEKITNKLDKEVIEIDDVYESFKIMGSIPIYRCKNIFHYINKVKILNDIDEKKDHELNSGINNKDLKSRLFYSNKEYIKRYAKSLQQLKTGKARVKNEYPSNIFTGLAKILSETYKPIIIGNKEKKQPINLTLF